MSRVLKYTTVEMEPRDHQCNGATTTCAINHADVVRLVVWTFFCVAARACQVSVQLGIDGPLDPRAELGRPNALILHT